VRGSIFGGGALDAASLHPDYELACLWIERGLGQPPVEVAAFMDALIPEGALRAAILGLRNVSLPAMRWTGDRPSPSWMTS
jgi:hypothetical protein